MANVIDIPIGALEEDTVINILDANGNIAVFVLINKHGYVNVDVNRSDAKARLFELNEEGHATINGRKELDLGDAKKKFVSVDFTVTDEAGYVGLPKEG